MTDEERRKRHGRTGPDNAVFDTFRSRYRAEAPDGTALIRGTIFVHGPTAVIAAKWTRGKGWVALGVYAVGAEPMVWATLGGRGEAEQRALLPATRIGDED